MFQKNHFNPARLLKIGLLASTSLMIISCGSDSSGENEADNQPENGSGSSPDDGTNTVPGAFTNTAIGNVLIFGSNGRTLYTFSSDVNGTSNCNDGCAEVWPPVYADSTQSVGEFSTLERADSSLQWSFKNSPLYFYQGDGAQGEINGEGINGVWFVARPDPIGTTDTVLGTVLTVVGSVSDGSGNAGQRLDFDGRTLYVFSNDSANTSTCYDGCAANWPPMYADIATQATGDYSIFTRDDGTLQWAYQNQPLYFYAGDTDAGDVNGEGRGGVWFVATP